MTHTFLARAGVPALALAVGLTLAACGADDGTGHDMADMGGASSSPDAPSDTATDAPFNAADVMFAQMMLPHHEQAIEMSDALLAKDGVSPELVDLAERIKAAQGPEIDTLTAWLGDWGADPEAGAGMGHDEHGMAGMMSAEDMQALEDATGADAERLFLEQMVAHHEGAVEMAQTEVSGGEHAGAVEMAQSVVDTQTAEIQQMRDLLASR
ncbi:DUF305 domain-containing protein, partial [Isoptericola sp. NPDC060257]|uniref:DUF305 domain-containing protein n=1 Tax=Isoptericola sp. NPDC060257 TaxID=3347087 RepID=UPI0036611D2B